MISSVVQSFSGSWVSTVITGLSALLGLFIGSAFGPVSGISPGFSFDLAVAQAIADERTAWALGTRLREWLRGWQARRTPSTDENWWVKPVLILGLLIWAVINYARHVEAVASGTVLAAFTLGLASAIALATLYHRGVVAGGAHARVLISGCMLLVAGIFDAIFLTYPIVGRHQLATLLGNLKTGRSVLAGTSLQFVGTQLVGVILFALVIVLFIAVCVSTVTSVYIAGNVVGQPIWKVAYWLTGWSLRPAIRWVIYITSVLSLLATSGLLFDGLHAFFSWLQRLTTPKPATPTPTNP